MKTTFSSQREMLLFLITNMAAVMSRANQHYTVFVLHTLYKVVTFRALHGLNSKVCALMKVFGLYFKVVHAVYLLV